jgi:choloylglycine hydrolase
MGRLINKTVGLVLVAFMLAAAGDRAEACTRTVYVGSDATVITGRNMDWREDMGSNLWVLPAGMKRDGAAGEHSVRWTAKYGSVGVSAYEGGTSDGMNEKGLVANLLYLAETDFGKPDGRRPLMSVSTWLQFVLDNFATVTETVEFFRSDPFQMLQTATSISATPLHLSISDPSGDSAIFEYIDGKLSIHHGKQYRVMTNSPIYEKQLAIHEYWKGIGGLVFLPGTNRAADRFARAAFFLDALPTSVDPRYIKGVPDQAYAYQAVAAVLSLQRAVSVPLGITTPNQPNISSTIWRTVSDHKNRVYYFDSATRPNTFWVSLSRLDLRPGAPVRKLTIDGGQIYSGDVSAEFKPAAPFRFLPAAH